jgi:hypothetical protein
LTFCAAVTADHIPDAVLLTYHNMHISFYALTEGSSTTGTLVDDGDYPPADRSNTNSNNNNGDRKKLANVSTNSRRSESKERDDSSNTTATVSSSTTTVLSPKRNGSHRSSADRSSDGRRSSNEGACMHVCGVHCQRLVNGLLNCFATACTI